MAEDSADLQEVVAAEFTLPLTPVARSASDGLWHAGNTSPALDLGPAGLVPITREELETEVLPERLSDRVPEGAGEVRAVAAWVTRCGAVVPLPDERGRAILAPDGWIEPAAERDAISSIGIRAAREAHELCSGCFPEGSLPDIPADPESPPSPDEVTSGPAGGAFFQSQQSPNGRWELIWGRRRGGRDRYWVLESGYGRYGGQGLVNPEAIADNGVFLLSSHTYDESSGHDWSRLEARGPDGEVMLSDDLPSVTAATALDPAGRFVAAQLRRNAPNVGDPCRVFVWDLVERRLLWSSPGPWQADEMTIDPTADRLTLRSDFVVQRRGQECGTVATSLRSGFTDEELAIAQIAADPWAAVEAIEILLSAPPPSTVEPTAEVCSLGHPMVIRRSRGRAFLGCSLFPEHREARPLPARASPGDRGEQDAALEEQARLALRFLDGYPARAARAFRCLGELAERRGDRSGALEAYERALATDPKIRIDKQRLAELRDNDGQGTR